MFVNASPPYISLRLSRDNKRTDVVPGFLVMLRVRSVAVRKLLAFPTPAQDGFVSHVLDVDFVDDFVAFHLDEVVASSARRFDGRRRGDQPFLMEKLVSERGNSRQSE